MIKMKLKCPESGSAQHPLSKASVRQFNSVIDIILIMFLQKLFFFFHGGNLVMRSEECTMVKLENYLSLFRNESVKSIR